MIRLAVVGLGKMGLSHYAMINTHPDVQVVGICDSSAYVLGVLKKYTSAVTYTDYDEMLHSADLDAVVIATPSSSHVQLVTKALERNLHVFCEKPFTLRPVDSESLTKLSEERGLVTQVGYHNRFVGAFQEAKALLEVGAIGKVTHALGEAYGPVVLKPKGATWRTERHEGGGCLYDYAAHAIDLLNWYMGSPIGVGGTVLNSIFSRDTEDEVFSTLFFGDGRSAQLSVNWSDESYRKMTTRITLWGTTGRIYVDRQECRVYLRDNAIMPSSYTSGWNVRYTTELTKPVWFYLRGEEYSAQLDAFVQRIKQESLDGINSFGSAAATDKVIELLLADAAQGASTASIDDSSEGVRRPRRRRLQWRGRPKNRGSV